MDVFSSRLDYFESDPEVDVSIVQKDLIEYRPIIPVTGNSKAPIHFEIPPNSQSFLDLKSSLLFVKLKVVKKAGGTALGDKEAVYPAQTFLTSLFGTVQVFLQNKLVYSSDGWTPYKYYIETYVRLRTKI